MPTHTVPAEENVFMLSSVSQKYLSFFVMGERGAGKPRRK
jgi:hypothetical protein